jgi:hypothetical protein
MNPSLKIPLINNELNQLTEENQETEEISR